MKPKFLVILSFLALSCEKTQTEQLAMSAANVSSATAAMIQGDPDYQTFVKNIKKVSTWEETHRVLPADFATKVGNCTTEKQLQNLMALYYQYSANIISYTKVNMALAAKLDSRYSESALRNALGSTWLVSPADGSALPIAAIPIEYCIATRDAAIEACHHTEYFLHAMCILGGFINVFAGISCSITTVLAAESCVNDALEAFDRCENTNGGY
jgi:hypothetical protein